MIRGGAGPVRQGAAGVQRTVDDLEASGGRVLGREITIEAGGVRTRPDLFVELPSGQPAFLEVKPGPSAGLTPNQTAAFPHIASQGGVPRGANAAAAGLAPGTAIGPTPGLNHATRHRPAGEVEINPVVGVRHQGVERIVAECRGEKFHAYQPSTVSTPLGYLLPENRYRVWVFGSDQSPEGVAHEMVEMVQTIEQYGVSFMRSTAALPELCRRLDEGIGFEHQVMYRRPVAWLLAGDPQRARDVLDETLARLTDRSDVAAEEFRHFGASLKSRLDDLASSGR